MVAKKIYILLHFYGNFKSEWCSVQEAGNFLRMKQVVLSESIFLKSRVYRTAKRIGTGIKLTTFLLTATVAYAAFLKRQRVFSLLPLACAGALLGGAWVSTPAFSADTIVPGTDNRVFTRGRKPDHSKAFAMQGVPAYVTSAQGTNYGVLIQKIDRAGIAGAIGIDGGDIILKVNGQTVETAKAIDHIYSETSGPVSVSFVHKGDTGLLLYNAQVAARGSVNSNDNNSKVAESYIAARNTASPAQEAAQAEAAMLAVINKDRASEGASPVRMNSVLTKFARERSIDMLKRGYFAHVDPDGVSPQVKAKAAGIVDGVYENISWRKGYASTMENAVACEQSMMEEPKNEKNHRYNILDKQHLTVGVGIAVSPTGVVFMTEEFSHTDPH